MVNQDREGAQESALKSKARPRAEVCPSKRAARVKIHGRGSPRARKPGKLIVIWAGGYPNPFATEAEEIAALNASSYNPLVSQAHSGSFQATAEKAQPDYRLRRMALNRDNFFWVLKAIQGPFRRIIFVGHGFSGGIAFSGRGYTHYEKLEKEDLQIPERRPLIERSIRPKLLPNTTIDLYACSVARNERIGKEFMKAMANVFYCRVRAFDEPLAWCTSHNGKKITSRGQIAPYSAARGLEGTILTCKEEIWKDVGNLEPNVIVDPEH